MPDVFFFFSFYKALNENSGAVKPSDCVACEKYRGATLPSHLIKSARVEKWKGAESRFGR